MLGLSGIMQISAELFDVVRYVGVLYLVYVGVSMIRDGGRISLSGAESDGQPLGPIVRRGILLNLLNPKLTIFFFAFLPQFLGGSTGLVDREMIGLGAIFMLISLIVFVFYAYASAIVRDRLIAAPATQRWLQRVFGTILLGVAARLALTDS